jgi:hypothetical protein
VAIALLIAVLGAACAYDEEELWGNCCALEIATEESNPKDGGLLIAWGRVGGFLGDGTSTQGDIAHAWRRRQFAYGFAVFQERHLPSKARDYLASLGMACTPLDNDPKTRRERCVVEAPVWATCTVKFGWPYFPNPVPKELRKPIPAVLHMTIDVSDSDIEGSSAHVSPMPGGRLCHR